MPQRGGEVDQTKGAEVQIKTTPLIAAAAEGRIDLVRNLLAAGANVNARASDGRTALIVATQNGRIEIVNILVKAGAALDDTTRYTGTALEVAERSGETQIAALLLAAGAHSSGKSVGDTVCVLPWGGDGYCGKVQSYSVRLVHLQVTRVVGCGLSCPSHDHEDCSMSRPVGGPGGIHEGDEVAVPSYCLTQTGVKP